MSLAAAWVVGLTLTLAGFAVRDQETRVTLRYTGLAVRTLAFLGFALVGPVLLLIVAISTNDLAIVFFALAALTFALVGYFAYALLRSIRRGYERDRAG